MTRLKSKNFADVAVDTALSSATVGDLMQHNQLMLKMIHDMEEQNRAAREMQQAELQKAIDYLLDVRQRAVEIDRIAREASHSAAHDENAANP